MTGTSRPRRGLLVGAGYFSSFHLDAWSRLSGADIVCICDQDGHKAHQAAERYGVRAACTDLHEALATPDLDFVDLVTPPHGRRELINLILQKHLPLIVQKPLADDFPEAEKIIELASASGVPVMIHENFRFQPWYREIKRLIDHGTLGERLHSIHMRTRLGDGWGSDAYVGRQPYFRTMPRLLFHETGVHFVDTFQYLAGTAVECQARINRWNPEITGEDAGSFTLHFASGAAATWDANRYNESLATDPRYTFGELVVDGDGGSLWLDSTGQITIKPLGKAPLVHPYSHSREGFGGDCVLACQRHFLDVLNGLAKCETSPQEYLSTLRIVEALYTSARENRPVRLAVNQAMRRRVVDLSLPINDQLPGAEVTSARVRERDGWNATILKLYSHCGTHIDAPRHFLDDGPTLDQLPLEQCVGPARIVNLTPVSPRQRLTIQDVRNAIGEVYPGDRLLFRTDWSHRFGTPSYRNELPRISIELAQWLVERQVALIGVESPSVADVNDLQELTDVHQTLFRGSVVIVEGLTHLDQLTSPAFEFFVLPLRIEGGDGCPVRAIAIEQQERSE